MASGGYRPGGGRPKGSLNKNTVRAPAQSTQSTQSTQSILAEKPKRQKPLDYMLEVMNDPSADDVRRDRMAIAAAPFCHPRRTDEGGGKRERDADAAKEAAIGKFAPPEPPKLVVNNQ